MARENEMQEFIRGFFRGRPDLSTLTHSIVRRRFLAHAGRDHLEPDEKQTLKRLVEKELLKVDEAEAREETLDLAKKAKRPPTPSSDPGRKRFRFNSESEPGSAASSPDCFGPPAKNGMVAAEVSPAEEESTKRVSKKAVEESSDEEEQQRDLAAKTGLEKVEAKESSEEEEEGSARTSKVSKEESSEEDEEEEEESKGRIRKEPLTRNKQAPGKTSASRKQAREESEDSEEEPIQRTRKKAEGKKGAKSHQESEKDSEEEDTLAKKKDNREEEENWKAGAWGNGGKKSAWEERSCKQKSRAARLLGDSGDREEEKEKARAGSGDNSGEDEEPLVQRKRKDRTPQKGGKRQSGSSEDEEDSWKKVKPTTEGTGKTAKVGSISDKASDSEREVSDSEAGGSPKGERENHSFKKSSRKGRTRSSSSSSTDGSPEPKGRKAGSGRRGEDHPAVMRLKRYIRACGAHRNYKKLLGPCRSHKERLSVLRAELEALGMKGNPSLEKCRALKEQREEAAEVASLDVTNIISGSGRPRRRTAWNPSGEADPPGELYRRTLGSEDEQPRAPPPDWSHMRGIISSDGESN
ncbi:HIRA-interacting protein 3 isoform X2 [Ailuropoda melanoleuca]|uniref:HIRA-interacting protein 3 isoform X2 n=1 Tax=Ailuropoda melanoleuca TaxID=9646 RepID=UPI00059AD2A9|nr:HIRA-interacting protein 3 isoform X2 [Ailuropoda melanoleuca]